MTASSCRKIRHMNRRQRKKMHVAEFQEFVFEIELTFRQSFDEAAYDIFIDDLIGLIESRGLSVGGLGGAIFLKKTSGTISASSRGSPTEEDRQAIQFWLQQRADIAAFDVGPFVDGWHGWDE